ncbi:hypothetical protein ACUALU_17105 [Nocardiopsis changdeensis]
MPHPPTAPDTLTATAPESYEKWYGRRLMVLYYLLGAHASAVALHFAAKLHYGAVETLERAGRSMPGWAAAQAVEAVTGYLVLPLSLAVGVIFFSVPWMKPQDLPAWVSAAHFRAAVARIRNGVVGGDPATDHVARIACENLIRRSSLEPKILLLAQTFSLGFWCLLLGPGLAMSAAEGDLFLVLLQAGSLLFFVGLHAAPWRLALLRYRALEYRELHEALLWRLHGAVR